MEEQRIGFMYWNLIKSRILRLWDSIFARGRRRSTILPWLLILVIVVPGILWMLHLKGRFGALKREVKGQNDVVIAQGPRPGGADPVVLTRMQTAGSTLPEFLSTTVLPGLGMSVLQITASLPGRGEIPLLAAPSLQQMADGVVEHTGVNDMRGALEVPWSGGINGLLSPIGTTISTIWRGHALELPTTAGTSAAISEGGLLTAETAETLQQTGGNSPTVNASFRATSFVDHWLAKTAVMTSIVLQPTAIEITVAAKNVGSEAEPMGIGWHPRFAFPADARRGVELKLPAGEVLALGDRFAGGAGSKLVAAGPAVTRFQDHAAPLGTEPIDTSLVHIRAGGRRVGAGKADPAEAGISTELRAPGAGFGLRLTALSASIRELRVVSPVQASYLSLGMQTNYDDPLGKEWAAEEGSGIVTLEPGQSLEWKIRLEIFPIANHASATP